MNKLKTTINIDSELWKKFSHLVIEKRGYRKKNEIIEQFIREYVEKIEKKTNAVINKAVILAAGVGSRLRPLTDDVPPCLLKINSITILEHQIKNLEKCGIEQVTVVTGHKAEKIKEFIQETFKDRNLTFNFIHNEYYSTTSNLFSLWLARGTFEGGFICLNSDTVFDVEILKSLLESEGDICLAVDKKECTEEDMKVKVKNGIIKIDKRIPKEEVYGEFIGIANFSERGEKKLIHALSNMPTDMRRKGYVSIGIQGLIDRGHKVCEVEIQRRFWKEIDFIEDLNEVRNQLLNDSTGLAT